MHLSDGLDTFSGTLIDPDGTQTNLTGDDWDSENIAWEADKNKFIHTDFDDRDDVTNVGPGGFPLGRVDDPHFMVWMRTAGLPTFKKLYAIINRDLTEGETLKISLQNTFPVAAFEGQKFIVISTTSWLGGKNSFLGYSYIVVGAICLFLCVAFSIKARFYSRTLGDMKYFNWPSNKVAAGGD